MKEKLKIRTKENYEIDGTLNYKENSDKLIIFVHGLSGSQDDPVFNDVEERFPEHGFSTFKFDLYSNERPLSNLTVKEHSKDLDSVLDFFKEKYKDIYLVGHSLGGPVILGSDISMVKSMCLWDPTLNLVNYADEKCTYDEKLGKYILHREVEVLISKEMVEEWKTIDKRIIQNIIKPTKIICAGKYRLKKHWIEHQSKINVNYELIVLDEADHCFTDIGFKERLFEETLKWFGG